MNYETIVSALFGGPAVPTRSDCDILLIQKDLIEAHNSFAAQQAREIEPKFQNIGSKQSGVSELLTRDINWLCAGPKDSEQARDMATLIRDLTHELPIIEVPGNHPNANLLTINKPTALFEETHCLAFQTPLLHLIHSIFSKIEMLICVDWKAHCAPQNEHLIESEEYSDVSLLFGIINDIHKVYIKRVSSLAISPPHLIDPYNYCERVEGARRFIVAHEIAHIYHIKFAGYEVPEWFQLGVAANEKEAQHSWRELRCDELALKMIACRFPSTLLDGQELYELENCMVGIQQFFTMLSIADMALAVSDENRISRLRSWERLMLFYRLLPELEVIKANPRVLEVVKHKVTFLNALQKVLSGNTSFHVAWGLEKRFTGDIRKLWQTFQESYDSLTTAGAFGYIASQNDDP